MTIQTSQTKSTIVEYAPGTLTNQPRLAGGDVLACGFGMTVAAWIAAYISRMPLFGAAVPGQVTIGLMLGMVFVGGILAGRYSHKGAWGAVWAGAVSGVLDILVVGSILHDAAKGDAVAPVAGLWVGGSVLLNALVAGAGGAVGALMASQRRANVRWGAVFAVVLACATLPLITAGGLVTAFGVGMAVPDWPRSYGYNMFLFPLSKMQSAEGNFYEHAHRLMGSLVGLTSLAVAIYATIAEPRRWVKGLVWTIFASVCVQGLLGGLRVTENSIPLATVHGIFAQVVFAAMACLAAIMADSGSEKSEGKSADRWLAGILLAALIGQLTLGALVRQRFDLLVLVHILMAAAVTLLALVNGFRAMVLSANRRLKWSGIALLTVVGIQLILGIMALAMRPEAGTKRTAVGAVWTTAHQANGAILLATAALIWVWTMRIPTKEEHVPTSDGLAGG